jgi:hypothetical protein
MRAYHLIFRSGCAPRELSSRGLEVMRASLRSVLRQNRQGRLVDLRLEQGNVHVCFEGPAASDPRDAMKMASRWLNQYLEP